MSDLYDTDVMGWSEHQADLLRRHAAGERANDPAIDWPHIIEEIEDVGRSELRSCKSLLRQALRHMLKAEAWPLSRDAPNWRADAIDFRRQARDAFTPSMRQKIDVPHDQRPSRDEADRVPGVGERLERATRQSEVSFRGLVGVGRRADHDLLALPRLPRELLAKDLDDVGLHPDRRSVSGVRGPVGHLLEGADETERASVDTTHVRVERPLEAHAPNAVKGRAAGFVAIDGPHRYVSIERVFYLCRPSPGGRVAAADRGGPRCIFPSSARSIT